MRYHGITMVGKFINQLVSSNPTWDSDDVGRLCFNYVSGELLCAGNLSESSYFTIIDSTNDQTIGGTKTFTTIPYLPSVDPTHDNHAVRKGYLDSIYGGGNLYKVKVTSNDTTADYLYSKLRAGDGITISEYNNGGNEDVQISITNIDTYVKTTGNQSIAGTKTFTSFPVLPSSAPTSNYQTAHKKYVDDQVAGTQSFTSGTKMIFFQASAPTGWTMITTYNDRVLRVVDGSTGYVGGNVSGSWTISGITTNNHTLTIDEIPSHTHTYSATIEYIKADAGGLSFLYYVSAAGTTGSTGGNMGHNHGVTADGTWRPACINVIVCSKD